MAGNRSEGRGRALRCAVALLVTLAAPALPLTAQYPTAPPPPGPLAPLQFPPFREARFANGLELLLVENHELPIVSIALAMPAGARYDPAGLEGLAGMTAELLTKGTRTRTAEQIAAEIEGVGGSLSASAGDDFFSLSLTVLTDHLELGFRLLSDVLLNAGFPSTEVELARKRVLSSLELDKSDPAALASRFFGQALYGAHPYGRASTDSSVTAITRGMIQAFASARLKPQGALLVVAGDLTLDAARQLVDRHLAGWRGAAPTQADDALPPRRPTTILLVDRPGSAQCNILVGNLALGPSDPGYYAAAVGGKILGGGADSRLFAILREQKSWTYSAGAGLARKQSTGYFSASTEVRTEVVDSALTELLYQLRRMRTEPVADSELVAAKGYLIGSFPLQIETPQQVAGQVSGSKLLGLPDDYLRTYRERLAQVTATDVLAAEQRVNTPDSAVIVIVGDAASTYERLRRIAPVQIIDLEGQARAPEDLAGKPGPLMFDTVQIPSRRDSFEVAVQGTPVGFMTATVARPTGSVIYVEETEISAVGLRQRTEVELDTGLAMRSVRQTGTGGGQTMDIRLTYGGGRVTGHAQIPDPKAGAPKVTRVDTTIAPATIDINAFQPLVAALPLAEGLSFEVPTFDVSEGTTRTMTVRVTGTQEVTVPAGRFTAFRAQVTGGLQPYVYYVGTDQPRRLLRIEIVGQPLTFELVK